MFKNRYSRSIHIVLVEMGQLVDGRYLICD